MNKVSWRLFFHSYSAIFWPLWYVPARPWLDIPSTAEWESIDESIIQCIQVKLSSRTQSRSPTCRSQLGIWVHIIISSHACMDRGTFRLLEKRLPSFKLEFWIIVTDYYSSSQSPPLSHRLPIALSPLSWWKMLAWSFSHPSTHPPSPNANARSIHYIVHTFSHIQGKTATRHISVF